MQEEEITTIRTTSGATVHVKVCTYRPEKYEPFKKGGYFLTELRAYQHNKVLHRVPLGEPTESELPFSRLELVALLLENLLSMFRDIRVDPKRIKTILGGVSSKPSLTALLESSAETKADRLESEIGDDYSPDAMSNVPIMSEESDMERFARTGRIRGRMI